MRRIFFPFFSKYKQFLFLMLTAAVLMSPSSMAMAEHTADTPQHSSAYLAETTVQEQLPSIHTNDLLQTLASAHGKVILVNFFAAFCSPCRREIPELIQMRREIPEKDLMIIGIAVDKTIQEADAFVQSLKIRNEYPVYYGGEELARAYRVSAIPFNVIYNRQGRIEVSESGYVPGADMKQFLMELIRR